jgi:hypothetical protein
VYKKDVARFMDVYEDLSEKVGYCGEFKRMKGTYGNMKANVTRRSA